MRLVPPSIPGVVGGLEPCLRMDTYSVQSMRDGGWALMPAAGPPLPDRGLPLNGTTQYATIDVRASQWFRCGVADSLTIAIEFEPDQPVFEDATRYLLDATTVRYSIAKLNAAGALNLTIVAAGTAIVTIPAATYGPFWTVGSRHLLVVALATGNNNVWLDTTQIVTANATAWTRATPDVLYVGAERTPSLYFDGSIGSVRLWPRALSAAEVADL